MDASRSTQHGQVAKDAKRYRWLVKTAPHVVAGIAYRYKSACRFAMYQPDDCVDAAIAEEEGGSGNDAGQS